MTSMKRNLKWFTAGFILLMIFPVIPVRAELFTPVLDGAKAAGEYSKATSYQVVFTDPSTSKSETGTVYAGRNTSHIHLALEMDYPAGNAQGSVAFAITYGEKTPSESQIMDRKGVIYTYELNMSVWHSVVIDQNEQQGTKITQNETGIDLAGAGGISQTKTFLEMSIPVLQTDSEPYDRHLELDEKLMVVLSVLRGYYNATENLEWGFDGRSEVYSLELASEDLILELASEESSSGFGLLTVTITIMIVVGAKKKRKK
ncbi:MAG: hypothetical protein ACFFD4_12025 [Candidatus Odinarchaeota archaeon]